MTVTDSRVWHVLDLLGTGTPQPPLPDRLCTPETHELGTAWTPAAERAAVEVCRRCPDLAPCRAWVTTSPRPVVAGVVGGLREAHR